VRFGVSTQLYHGQRLCEAHLAEMANHGFDTIEIIATRSHVDYHDPEVLETLAAWLAGTGQRLHSIHGPITECVINGRWGPPFSNASPSEPVRRRAVAEALAALDIARRVPVEFMVLHLGLPTSLLQSGEPNSRSAVRRSIDEIVAVARPLGVRLALENIPDGLSTPDSIVPLIEEELEHPDLGACLDFGHAHLMGGVVDAIEAFSGVLATTHLHDNHGGRDEHLPPFEGTIEWPRALMALEKIGYAGVMMVEVASNGAPSGEVLDRTQRACARLEAETRSWS
jgi:sugar phosphate isomerase/epimerase